MRRIAVFTAVLIALVLVGCSLFSYTIPYEKINKQTRNKTIKVADFKVGQVDMHDLRFGKGAGNSLKVDVALVLQVRRPFTRRFDTTASVSCTPEMNWPNITCKDYRDWAVTLGPVKIGISDLGPKVNDLLEAELRKQIKKVFASDKVPAKYRNKLDKWGPYLKLEAVDEGFKLSLK